MIFKGTIIDFETTGDFDENYQSPDPRYFGDITPTLFGYLINDKMVQYCAEGPVKFKTSYRLSQKQSQCLMSHIIP